MRLCCSLTEECASCERVLGRGWSREQDEPVTGSWQRKTGDEAGPAAVDPVEGRVRRRSALPQPCPDTKPDPGMDQGSGGELNGISLMGWE